MKIKIQIILLGLLIGMASCNPKGRVAGEGNYVGVKLKKIELKKVPRQYELSGRVVAENQVVVSTKLQGTIDGILVAEGQEVSEGDLLVRINSSELKSKLSSMKASLKAAHAQFINTQKTFTRIKNLFGKGSATKAELDYATTAFDAAKAGEESIKQHINELKATLNYASLRAEVNGIVTKKHSHVGSMALPGKPILTIETVDELKIEAFVPESNIKLIGAGDEVEIFIGDAKYQGIIKHFIPSSGTYGPQYKIEVNILGEDNPIYPGMFASLILKKGTRDKILVPGSALYKKGQLSGIFTVTDNNEVILRWLRLGKSYEEGIEVLSGLQAGEFYIISASGRIQNGDKVKILNN